MLIFFAFVFLYKKHCHLSMNVTFKLFTVLNIYLKLFYLILKKFFSDNSNKIAKNKVFVSVKLHAKIMSIFFPHNFNRVTMIFI